MRREETGGDTGGSPEDAAELRVPHPELHRVQHRTVPGLRAHCSERRLRFLCLPTARFSCPNPLTHRPGDRSGPSRSSAPRISSALRSPVLSSVNAH